jgi:hypothetical protein
MPTAITHRVGLGRNLTAAEVDANFDGLNAADGIIAASIVGKQDALIAGANITIAPDGRTISAVGTGGATPIVNDLTTGGVSSALSAQQGVVVKAALDAHTTQIAGKQATLLTPADVPGLTAALTAKQFTLTAPGDVPGLTAALAAKAPNILTGLATADSSDVVATDTPLVGFGKLMAKFLAFAASVRGTSLTGLSTASAIDVTSSDSVLTAFGKIQAKLSAIGSSALTTVLTGLSTATTGAVTAADTILAAIGKLEATKAAVLAPVALTTATTLTASAHGNRQITFTGADANLTIASDGAGGWAADDSVEVHTLTGSTGVPTLVTPDGKSVTGSATKIIGATRKGSGAWTVGTTDPATGGGSGDMVLASAQNVTGAKTFSSTKLLLGGSTSGAAQLNAPAVAGTNVYTLPATTGTLDLASIPSGTTVTTSRNLAVGDISKITRVDTAGGAVVLTLVGSTIAAGDKMFFQRNGANALTFSGVGNPNSVTCPDTGIVCVFGSLITAGAAVLVG